MKKPKINTMEELSAAIGVSRPTLSRYFQSPESVRKSTSEKIRKGLEQVEYVPNFFATRMNRKSTGMIGVVMPYFNDLFFTRLLQSIEIAAMKAGYTVITQCSHSDAAIEARAAETFLSMNVDGVIVAPLGNYSDLSVHKRLQAQLPFVLVDSRPATMPNIDFVGTDHVQSVGLMVKYLCRVGDPPVFLAMPSVNFNAMEREAAYRHQMEILGHEPVVIGREMSGRPWHFEAHGETVLTEYFSRDEYTEQSIFCANDRIAIGALRAASRHGLVPGRSKEGGLRIAGHDDYPISPFMVPALTTVAQDVDAIGQAAVSRLTQVIAGGDSDGDPRITFFDGSLRLRESA